MTGHHHPRPHDSGAVVKIDQPTQPTPPLSWPDRMAVAVFVPDGPAPSQLAGIAMQAAGLPATAAGWDALAGHTNEADPPPPTVPSGTHQPLWRVSSHLSKGHHRKRLVASGNGGEGSVRGNWAVGPAWGFPDRCAPHDQHYPILHRKPDQRHAGGYGMGNPGGLARPGS